MMIRRTSFIFLLGALILTLTSPTASAARPDLVVRKGKVREQQGMFVGSIVVARKGPGAAGRSSATLSVINHGRRQFIQRVRVGSLRRRRSRRVKFNGEVPFNLTAGRHRVVVCADSRKQIRERSESNNCRTVATIHVDDSDPAASIPTDPMSYTAETPFKLTSSQSDFWVYVPTSYDASHNTATTLFVWMHGCGGEAEGDIWDVSPGGDSQSWITISIGGRDGGCWHTGTDQGKPLAAISSMKRHFNINPRTVVLGGYSSGGDLAYRTAFYHAGGIAGVLAACTAPFRDSGSSDTESLAAADWKFNIAHLAMLEDDTYPVSTVRNEINTLKDAGYPVTYVERHGTHTGCDGTQLRAHLLPHLNDGWTTP